MDINILDSGKITLSKNGKVQNILPFGFFHRHPRNSNAILITSEAAPIESKGISVDNITLEGKKISIDDFLNHVSENKGNNGSTSNENIAKKLYLEFSKIDNYEDMLVFARKHQNNVGGIKMQNNRLVQEEIRVHYHTLQLIVTLTYYYLSPSSNRIKKISMSGTVSNINLTVKVYKYDASENIIGYEYKNILQI